MMHIAVTSLLVAALAYWNPNFMQHPSLPMLGPGPVDPMMPRIAPNPIALGVASLIIGCASGYLLDGKKDLLSMDCLCPNIAGSAVVALMAWQHEKWDTKLPDGDVAVAAVYGVGYLVGAWVSLLVEANHTRCMLSVIRSIFLDKMPIPTLKISTPPFLVLMV
jgi:hypothetical protein